MATKLGLIGGGAIGRVHLQAAQRAGVHVACVADVVEEAAKAAAAAHNVPQSTGDIAQLLDSDVDAVIVAVPNKFHKPLTVQALEAGKHVMVEKPMALTVAECDEMLAAAKKAKKILQVGQVHRYTPVARTAKTFIDKGRLGHVYHAKANYYRRRGIPGLGGWFTTKALSGGGPLIDLGVHIIDLCLFLTDFPRPTRVSGKVYANFGPRMRKYVYESMWAGPPKFNGVFDVEDSAHALIRFEGGMTMEVNTTWAGNFPDDALSNVIGFFGDKGGMTFQLGGREIQLATEMDGHNVDMSPKLRDADHFADQVAAFAEAVKKNKPNHATGERGRTVQTILDAIYASSEQDREVEL